MEAILEQIGKINDKEQLKAINHIVCERIRQMQDLEGKIASTRFSVGDKVWFNSKKRGGRQDGTITKINQKTANVIVKEPFPVTWKVYFQHLNKSSIAA